MLKWPNDVMMLGKKLAGILLERGGDRVAVGFGVNLASAPTIPDRQGASLEGKVTPQAFAPLLAGSFARLIGLWRHSEPASIARAWLARAHPVGTAAHGFTPMLTKQYPAASTVSNPTARSAFAAKMARSTSCAPATSSCEAAKLRTLADLARARA